MLALYPTLTLTVSNVAPISMIAAPAIGQFQPLEGAPESGWRPEPWVAPDLWACGDYMVGPYPSTLEGAVRSGQQVVTQLSQMTHR